MGNQNTNQIQGQSPVMIDHPRFQNAKVSQQKGTIYMSTSISIQQKEFNKWKQQISVLKMNPEYLLMPKKQQFNTKGFCGSTGTLNVSYEYFPYLLMQEIQNRKKRKSRFQQCELWFLLFSLSAAQIQMKKIFDCKVGDIRPQNIFINQQGQIKLSCLHSWPRQASNFEKTFDHQQTLLAPEDMNKLQLGGMDDLKNYQSQIFSIGMTILSAGLLNDFTDVYDVKKFKFKFDEAGQYLTEWRNNTLYSQIFTAFISNLCSFQPQKRLNEKQLWSWINKYEEQIKNKDDFVIEHAPLKIEKQIQQIRGESNINMLQQNNNRPGMIPQNLPFQQRSVVFPFVQGLSEQRVINPPNNPISVQSLHQRPSLIPGMNIPVNQTVPPRMLESIQPRMVSPRQNIPYQPVQSVHHNIQTAQSMYTQIPPQIYQNRFVGTLPPGVIQNRSMPGFPAGQRVFSPPSQNFMPQTQTGGNFVYTRRIIDPNSNSVVVEQRIGEQQYHRGIGETQQQQSNF